MTLIVTLIVLLVAFLGLVIFDIYLAASAGYCATISYQTLAAAKQEPIIPLIVGLVLGMLLGHIFWPQYSR